MNKVFAIATNVTSALGLNTYANWKAVASGQRGIQQYEDTAPSNTPFQASKLSPAQWQHIHTHTRSATTLSPFEQLAIYSAKQALEDCSTIPDPSETVLILATTKGNIEWLGSMPDERIALHTSANIISGQLNLQSAPIVISHACVSGVTALQYGLRLLQKGRYKNAIVVGCDRFSRFVLSGFQSFLAVSSEPCMPFDAARTGITLGEAGATIILSTYSGDNPQAVLMSGATSNDANHISGPSRTGEELALAINSTLKEGNILPAQIDMISAHGTATMYNDEMEAKAFALSGLLHSHVHSLKGYIGHTLGAAGVAESVMAIESINNQQLIPSAGYSTRGVSEPLRITRSASGANVNFILKTASGFGGCNAAILWGKV